MNKKLCIVFIAVLLLSSFVVFLPKVRADSTFGSNFTSGSSVSNPSTRVRANSYAVGDDGTIHTLSIYGNCVSGTTQVTLCVYSDLDGSPDVLLGQGEVSVDETLQFWNVSVEVSFLAGTYWLGWVPNTNFFTYDGTAGTRAYGSTFSYGSSLPNPFGSASGFDAHNYPIYATYTIYVAPTPTPSPSPSPSPTPTPTDSPTPTPSISPTPTASPSDTWHPHGGDSSQSWMLNVNVGETVLIVGVAVCAYLLLRGGKKK